MGHSDQSTIFTGRRFEYKLLRPNHYPQVQLPMKFSAVFSDAAAAMRKRPPAMRKRRHRNAEALKCESDRHRIAKTPAMRKRPECGSNADSLISIFLATALQGTLATWLSGSLAPWTTPWLRRTKSSTQAKGIIPADD